MDGSVHPTWFCKRDPCTGLLTLLGSGKLKAFDDNIKARARADLQRLAYPITNTHGALLTCSDCGNACFRLFPWLDREHLKVDARG